MIVNAKYNSELMGISVPNKPIVYSKHAEERGLEKQIRLIKTITVVKKEVVELYPNQNKYVVRKTNLEDKNYDTVFVLIDMIKYWKCITVYKNHKNDNHSTLKLAA